ncbi:MAG: FGGY family carbohydrate kinase [Actinobacteria bacterium]|nr:FGGY family carbohydrate kinase [Actinomycetota bacterium]MCL5770943.1 FGGY family carbohydrate kinase [Actinomycetota bacterium]
MVTKYIAGIDIGTTNIKGSLFSVDGKLISTSKMTYSSYTPKENYFEQDAEDWIMGFFKVLKSLLINESVKKNLEAISLSTQGGTVIPVDKDFKPLCRAITYLDRRGSKILKNKPELQNKNIWFYNKTGWRIDSCLSFLSIYWLKKYENSIFKKIYKILYVNDYVLKKITGNNFQDPSNASITQFYNVRTGMWDDEILSLLGLNNNNFSEIKKSCEFVGLLKNEIRKELDLRNKVKIINGGHDQYCVSIGNGILNEEDFLISTGTAWTIFKLLNRPLFDSKFFYGIGRNVINEKFGLIYSIPTAGAALRWFALNIMNLDGENKLYEVEKKEYEKLLSIRNKILFYPYLSGNFGPDFVINQKGAFTNLELGHNYLDMFKAIMEGIGFQLKKILETFKKEKAGFSSIKIVGGASKSDLWMQIIANIIGKIINIPKKIDEDFASKGAAIIAGFGAGIFSSIEEGYSKFKTDFTSIKPSKEIQKYYLEKYKSFNC